MSVNIGQERFEFSLSVNSFDESPSSKSPT